MSPTPLDGRVIASHILSIERSLDLNHVDWLIEDVHLWPLYRLELYRLFFISQTKSTSRPKIPAIASALRFCRISSRKAKQNYRIWLISNGVTFTQLGEMEIERFCEPIHHALSELNESSVLIDSGSPYLRPSAVPTRWHSPMTMRAKLIGMLRAFALPDKRHHRLVSTIKENAERLGITLPSIDARLFNAKTNAMLWLAAILTKRMNNEGVKFVFLVCYYDVVGYAYTLAANRVGALSVDVQHGVTGEFHMAYASWNIRIAADFSLLPKCFWCWSDDEAQIVRNWTAKHPSIKTDAVVGGHPFIQAWHADNIQLPVIVKATLNRLLKSTEGRSPVLVTVQPHLISSDSLAPLLAAWRQQPRVAWWIRLHPAGINDREKIITLLESHDVSCWDIDDVTSLPLPELFRHVCLHITHSSSCVLEAEKMGVKSVLLSQFGAQYFAPQVRRGTAIYAQNGDRIIHLLVNHSGRPSYSTEKSETNCMKNALKTLMERVNF